MYCLILVLIVVLILSLLLVFKNKISKNYIDIGLKVAVIVLFVLGNIRSFLNDNFIWVINGGTYGEIYYEKIDINKLGKTAILMPVYNEDILKVLARILAISEDLIKENIASIYDIYILSDTTNKEILKQEEEIWLKAKQLIEPNINLYYRHRIKNTARKSGNIEDFLKRWGSLYDYMLVLDADSLMTANTIYKMTYMMAKTPHAGIIQAPPHL